MEGQQFVPWQQTRSVGLGCCHSPPPRRSLCTSIYKLTECPRQALSNTACLPARSSCFCEDQRRAPRGQCPGDTAVFPCAHHPGLGGLKAWWQGVRRAQLWCELRDSSSWGAGLQIVECALSWQHHGVLALLESNMWGWSQLGEARVVHT